MGKCLEKDSSFPQRRPPLFFFPYFALPSSRARKIRPEKVKKRNVCRQVRNFTSSKREVCKVQSSTPHCFVALPSR